MPVDMRRKGEDGLGQFGPALFACKALPFVSCKKKMPMPHKEEKLFTVTKNGSKKVEKGQVCLFSESQVLSRSFPHPENGPRSGPGPQKMDLGPDLDHKLAVL